jgi:hypothetical protein
LSYIIENEEMIGGENHVVEIDKCIRMNRKRAIGTVCFSSVVTKIYRKD